MIAAASQPRRAAVTLAVTVSLPTLPGVTRIDVQTAREMAAAVEAALPAAAVMVAAVADWRTEAAIDKIKKTGDGAPPPPAFTEIPTSSPRSRHPPPTPAGRGLRRNLGRDRERDRQAHPQGRRLDRRQRCPSDVMGG